MLADDMQTAHTGSLNHFRKIGRVDGPARKYTRQCNPWRPCEHSNALLMQRHGSQG